MHERSVSVSVSQILVLCLCDLSVLPCDSQLQRELQSVSQSIINALRMCYTENWSKCNVKRNFFLNAATRLWFVPHFWLSFLQELTWRRAADRFEWKVCKVHMRTRSLWNVTDELKCSSLKDIQRKSKVLEETGKEESARIVPPPPSNERTWCKFVSKVVVWCRMYLCLEQVNRHTVFVLICQSSNKAVCVSIAQTQLNEQ